MTHAQAGRRGALVTLERHGIRDMSAMGKLGGRKRLPTLSELQAIRLEIEKGGKSQNT